MTDLQKFIDMPLDSESHSRINKVFLPMGRRPAPRAKSQSDGIDENFMPKVKRSKLKEMSERAYVEGLGKVLDYYATTTVPFERVAEHTGLSLENATQAMTRRGRVE